MPHLIPTALVNDLTKLMKLGKLQLDDPSLQPDHCGVRSIVSPQLGKDGLDSALDGFFRDGKLVRDLLVCIAGCDQSQHSDFCRSQAVINRMLGDLVRSLWGKSLLSSMDCTDRLQ